MRTEAPMASPAAGPPTTAMPIPAARPEPVPGPVPGSVPGFGPAAEHIGVYAEPYAVPAPRIGGVHRGTGWLGGIFSASPRGSAEEPVPPFARMVGLSAWAATLTLVGMAVAGRAFLATLFTPDLPGYFEPAVITAGLAGVALTILALAAVQRRYLPWLLLPCASVALAAALIVTAAAT